METQVKQGIVRGRPNGGVVTYIRTGQPAAKYVECSERVNIIIIGELAIVNVHVHSCGRVIERDIVMSILDSIVVSARHVSWRTL